MINHKRRVFHIEEPLKISIAIVIMFVIMSSSLFKYVEVKAKSDSAEKNMIYVELINYCLPVVKSTNFQSEDMAEDVVSFKSIITQAFNIDSSDPMSVMDKEVTCLANYKEPENLNLVLKQTDANSSQPVDSISSFQLNENDVSIVKNDPKGLESLVFASSLKKQLNPAKPEVLIYHSHTTESYAPYGDTNMEADKNVCAVGDALAKELEKYGICTIHDTTIHNATAYTQSYKRSGETLDRYLKKYGDFKVIIDLHRDSVPNKDQETININGVSVAKFMFVMADKNPHYSKNIALVNKLISASDKEFKGLCKGTYLYHYGSNYFNQAKSNNAILIEVGSNVNTLTEAKNTAPFIARLIAESLNGK